MVMKLPSYSHTCNSDANNNNETIVVVTGTL